MEEVKLTFTPEVSRLLSAISSLLREKNIRAYLVGGTVRDRLLGRDTADIDLAVSADALEAAALLADALHGKYVPLDAVNRVGRVVLPEAGSAAHLDLSTVKGTIEDDLARRDFTIDAIAARLEEIAPPVAALADSRPLSLDERRLIDPVNGRGDLRRGLVRSVSEANLVADPVRLLRAVRLATELGFTIEDSTRTLIRRHCHLAGSVAGERAREELLRLLAPPGAARYLRLMDELGLLTVLIPELIACRGVDQPPVHYWDVFDHSLETVAAVEFLFGEEDLPYASAELLAAVPRSEKLSRHFHREISRGSTGQTLLKLAALLHDIAKPQTKTVDGEGRARFLGHSQEGAAMSAAVLERLRFSSREIRTVALLVQHHLRPGQMSNYGTPTDRAIYRFFRDTGEAGIDILFLSMADHLAARGPRLDPQEWRRHARFVDYVLARHCAPAGPARPPRLVDGHDLMNIFGFSPGPGLGAILETLREAQAAGEVSSREEALEYVKNLIEGK